MLLAAPTEPQAAHGRAGEIVLDPEFQNLLPEPCPEEKALLQDALRKEGCLEPLLVWQHGPRLLLLTGYDVFPMVQEWGLPFSIVVKEFASREAARFFLIDDQLARRNPGPLLISYLRGLHYAGSRQRHGGDRRSPGTGRRGKTAVALAERFHVSPATIARDGAVADALGTIAVNCGDHVRRWLLRRDAGLSRSGLLDLARRPAQQQKELIMAWRLSGRWPRGWRDIDRPAKVTLPAEPEGFVAALLRKLGEDFAWTVYQLLREQLAADEDHPYG